MVIMVIAFVVVLLINLLGSGKNKQKNNGNDGAKNRYVAGNDKRSWEIFCWMWTFAWMAAYLQFWVHLDAEKV